MNIHQRVYLSLHLYTKRKYVFHSASMVLSHLMPAEVGPGLSFADERDENPGVEKAQFSGAQAIHC